MLYGLFHPLAFATSRKQRDNKVFVVLATAVCNVKFTEITEDMRYFEIQKQKQLCQ